MFQQFIQRINQPQRYPIYLFFLALLSTLLVHIPYYFSDPTILHRFWDGPNYMYVAKTLYNIPANHPFTPYKTTPAYFACHLPLYPLAIKALAWIFGYQNAMLVVTLLFTGVATVALYYLLQESGAVANPFWSAFISLFLPVRWLVYHSVGATEPLFLSLIFLSLLFYLRKQYALAFLFAGLSSITRIVGILMGLVYLIMLIRDKEWKKMPLLGIIPLGLLATFSFYHYQFGDFFAYFQWNAKLIDYTPFKILWVYASNFSQGRIETLHSAEFYLMLYSIYGCGTLLLWRYPLFFWYCTVYYIFNSFIFHEDLSRYMISIAPLALVVGYDRIINTSAFRLASIVLIGLSYVYVWQILQHNVMVDWVYKDLLKVL